MNYNDVLLFAGYAGDGAGGNRAVAPISAQALQQALVTEEVAARGGTLGDTGCFGTQGAALFSNFGVTGWHNTPSAYAWRWRWQGDIRHRGMRPSTATVCGESGRSNGGCIAIILSCDPVHNPQCDDSAQDSKEPPIGLLLS